MSEELKACPFCGGAAKLAFPLNISHGGIGLIYCLANCGAEMRCRVNAEAIAAWNTRAPIERLEAENRQMREALERVSAVPTSEPMDAVSTADRLEMACDEMKEIARATLASLPVQP